MTEDELIDMERRAVDMIEWRSTAQRKRLYRKMREHSRLNRRQPLPNDVSAADAWLQLTLRAKDIAGVSDRAGWYLPPDKRK